VNTAPRQQNEEKEDCPQSVLQEKFPENSIHSHPLPLPARQAPLRELLMFLEFTYLNYISNGI
jgi:hypothetical protein